MWRETKILLIDDNIERRRDLTVILNFLGEEHLACDSALWKATVADLESSRAVLCVMLGDVQSSGELLEQVKQLVSWDEFLPVLLIDESAPAEWPEDNRRSVLASQASTA